MTEIREIFSSMLLWLPDIFQTFFKGIFLVCVAVTFADIFLTIIHFIRGR